jgi:hypothetical protein
MAIDKRWQLDVPYEQYAQKRVKQIINTLTPEKQQAVAEQIQARILLSGSKVVNQELYEEFLRKLHSSDRENNGIKNSKNTGI